MIGIPFAIGSRLHPSNKDLGGLIVIEYGDHTSKQSSYLLNSKKDDLTHYWSSYHIAGNFRKVLIFGYFEEALLFENKFPRPVVFQK